MTDDVVRMHLAQAYTRAIDPDARAHLRIAFDTWEDAFADAVESADAATNDCRPRVAADLETWLVSQAQRGVPELVLAGLLRRYAAHIDGDGCVSRAWMDTHDSGSAIREETTQPHPNLDHQEMDTPACGCHGLDPDDRQDGGDADQ